MLSPIVFPLEGMEASLWHVVWLMQPLSACVACALMRWLMECDSGTEADPASRWTEFRNLTAVSHYVFPLPWDVSDFLLSWHYGKFAEMLIQGERRYWATQGKIYVD